jgi:8-oxo-dGTP pyrophosphatase MutT (NUDIX family)
MTGAQSAASDEPVGEVVSRGVDERGAAVCVRRTRPGVAELSWTESTPGEPAAASTGVRAAVEQALAHGLIRVESRVPVSQPDRVRTAARAGLRREGALRGGADTEDTLLLARLAGDPAPDTRDGFVALLNAGLPTKRVISHGLLRDPAGRVLLCELTYKPEWDLPGGVVEPGESPREGVRREVREEIGLDVESPRLLTVNWLPSWRSWDDACVFVFDLGVHDASMTDRLTLQPTEIAGVHWCDPADVARHAAAATARLLAYVREQPAGSPYLEGGAEVTEV